MTEYVKLPGTVEDLLYCADHFDTDDDSFVYQMKLRAMHDAPAWEASRAHHGIPTDCPSQTSHEPPFTRANKTPRP